MPFTPEEMIVVQQQRQEATLKARAQGVIIGETHDNAHGRGLVCNLVRDRAVHTVFLEVPDMPLYAVAHDIPDHTSPDLHLGQWLRQVAASSNRDLMQYPLWHQVKPRLQHICSAENTGGNPAKTTRLIELAVQEGARIYLVDYEPQRYKHGNPNSKPNFLKNIGPLPTSPDGMRLRDKHISLKIMEVTNGNAAGTALLVGRDHGRSGTFDHLNMGRVDVIKAAH